MPSECKEALRCLTVSCVCALPAALMALKNKKLYETQLEQVETNMLRVNEQKIMLENQRTTIETVSALKTGADTSKATMKEMNIDKVDQIFDDINEQNDQMREIQEALGQSVGACSSFPGACTSISDPLLPIP